MKYLNLFKIFEKGDITFNCESCSMARPNYYLSPKPYTCDSCFEDESECEYCSCKKSWCTSCEMFSRNCCEEYGTCQCS